MNRKQNNKKRILSFLLCISLIIMSFTGCGNETGEIKEGKNYIYYIDKKISKLVPKEYKINAKIENEQVEELLKQLRLNTDDVEISKAIPDGVGIDDYYLEDGVLSIYFDANYSSMEKAQEVLTRAAVVLTMSQLDGVSYVSFSVAGQPLAQSNGEAVGNMQAADFADNLDSNRIVNNIGNFTIYFANQQGTKLVKYDFEAEYGSNMSREQFIVNKLIEGPGEEEGYVRTIPGNVEVVSVMSMDNICYVTFGENFLTEPAGVSDDLIIYSIVNSLSEIPYIHKVQIAVNGHTDAIYHGAISLSEPFSRNLDYVEKSEENVVEGDDGVVNEEVIE